MAVVPDYKSGTASVTAGQRAVTGTGTAWQVSPNEPVVRPGDLFGRAGLWVPIESVTDNTHLTLAEDWSGATLTNSEYRIRFQSDGSRYTAAARTLVEMLSNGILANLAGVAGAADKLPYMTGATTFGLADLTAFARSLLDDVSAAAMRSTLGLAAGANTAAAYRGAFSPAAFPGADLTPAEVQTLIGGAGFYEFCSPDTGIFVSVPGTWPQAFGVVRGYVTNNNTYQYSWQEFTGLSGNSKWQRRATSATTWSAWALVFHQGNVLGTVSQSGGVPTGAIVQRGSNANGEFVRLADGTQLCTFRGTQTFAISTVAGSLYRSSHITWTYPAAFVAPPSFVEGGIVADSDINMVTVFGSNQYTATATAAQIALFAGLSVASASRTVMYRAEGRWF